MHQEKSAGRSSKDITKKEGKKRAIHCQHHIHGIAYNYDPEKDETADNRKESNFGAYFLKCVPGTRFWSIVHRSRATALNGNDIMYEGLDYLQGVALLRLAVDKVRAELKDKPGYEIVNLNREDNSLEAAEKELKELGVFNSPREMLTIDCLGGKPIFQLDSEKITSYERKLEIDLTFGVWKDFEKVQTEAHGHKCSAGEGECITRRIMACGPIESLLEYLPRLRTNIVERLVYNLDSEMKDALQEVVERNKELSELEKHLSKRIPLLSDKYSAAARELSMKMDYVAGAGWGHIAPPGEDIHNSYSSKYILEKDRETNSWTIVQYHTVVRRGDNTDRYIVQDGLDFVEGLVELYRKTENECISHKKTKNCYCSPGQYHGPNSLETALETVGLRRPSNVKEGFVAGLKRRMGLNR